MLAVSKRYASGCGEIHVQLVQVAIRLAEVMEDKVRIEQTWQCRYLKLQRHDS
jgi:hypothetical protein